MRCSGTKTAFVVCLSGGVDSTTLLNLVIRDIQCTQIMAVTFKYPSKHNQLEREAAQRVADHFGVQLITVDVTSFFHGMNSPLISKNVPVPEGHYTDDSMKSTVVPMRNNIFANCAVSRAVDYFGDDFFIVLGMGVHAGDHPIYPDCRPDSIHALTESVTHASNMQAKVFAPFLHSEKWEIIEEGVKMETPYQLTRTCYKENELACGKCGSCVERLESFARVGVEDPIEYVKNPLDKNLKLV